MCVPSGLSLSPGQAAELATVARVQSAGESTQAWLSMPLQVEACTLRRIVREWSRHRPLTRSSLAGVDEKRWLAWPLQAWSCTAAPCRAPATVAQRFDAGLYSDPSPRSTQRCRSAPVQGQAARPAPDTGSAGCRHCPDSVMTRDATVSPVPTMRYRVPVRLARYSSPSTSSPNATGWLIVPAGIGSSTRGWPSSKVIERTAVLQ